MVSIVDPRPRPTRSRQLYRSQVPDSANGTTWAELRVNTADLSNYDRGRYVGPPVYIGPVKEEATCRCRLPWPGDEGRERPRPLYVGCCPDADCQRRQR